jgi:hypothetical protein
MRINVITRMSAGCIVGETQAVRVPLVLASPDTANGAHRASEDSREHTEYQGHSSIAQGQTI